MYSRLELITYPLCPYVQRSVITLLEKSVSFVRTDIDLSAKPGWFQTLSPTGKVPLLRVDNRYVIFESAVICEYLDEVTEGSLLPNSPEERALQRSWIEYASQTLELVARYYSETDRFRFVQVEQQLKERFKALEERITGPYFSGSGFMLVDAAYAPIFRYFDVFSSVVDINLFDDCPKVQLWREAMRRRASVKHAVADDYANQLLMFTKKKGGYLSGLIQQVALKEN